MQPTYLPWLGYLDMIDKVDVFVFLDSVQFSKRSWQQRNRIKGDRGLMWLTVPVLNKGRRDQLICEVEIDQEQTYIAKHVSSIKRCYGKSRFSAPVIAEYAELMERKHQLLVDLNIDLIKWLCGCFDIHTPLLRSSDLAVGGQKSSLLVQICQQVCADFYLSAPGSREYIELEDQFSPNGIEVGYHTYSHPHYKQLYEPFETHLSAIDLLLNAGGNSTAIFRPDD